THCRHHHFAGHGVFRDLHDAHDGVAQGGVVPGDHVRSHGERQSPDLTRRNSVKSRVLAAALPAVLTLVLVNGAWARNPHCAGGIQYLTQALADNSKGNKEDYEREIAKAVSQLEACAQEDPQDFEGIGYLGWAYAQVDSMCPAGKAFQTAVDGLTAKGDKKKLEQVQANQKSFWAQAFNKGIGNIQTAQGLWNPYTNEPANDADKQAKADAKKSYDA